MPEEWLGSEVNWIPVSWGRWKWADHITLGEGRASLRGLEALSCCSRAHRHVVISLQDNMSWHGAAAKGRSPSAPLNFLLRRRAALAIATEIRMLLPWVQTAKQPADWLTRW